MSSGWIKVYRAMDDNPLLQDMARRGFWVSLLILATHRPKQALFGGKVFDLQPGQFVTSERALADRFNLPKTTVRRWLREFELAQMVDLETDQGRTVVTIVNWPLYQHSQPETDRPADQGMDREWTSHGPATDQIQEVKEQENINPPVVPPSAKPSKRQFAEHVHLTDAEFGRLVERFGEPAARRMIEILDNYKGANGRRYKSDYRAILSWVVERYEREQRRNGRPARASPAYDPDDPAHRILNV